MEQSQIKKQVTIVVIVSIILFFLLLVGVIFQIIKIHQLEKEKQEQEKDLQSQEQLFVTAYKSVYRLNKKLIIKNSIK